MFVVFSKLFWFLAQPLSLVLIGGVAGLLLGLTRWRRTSRLLLASSLAILALAGFTSLGHLAIAPLEARFERPAEVPEDVAGFIVLGGGMDADINAVRGGYELGRSGDRFTEALRLALLHPEAKIVFTGGSGVFVDSGDSEAAAAARFLAAFGVAEERMVLEEAARNTEENAQFARRLLGPEAEKTWLLITSAYHMPRAVGLFRRAGMAVIPWPADYLGSGEEGFGLRLAQPPENLAVASIAMREWVGLVAYYLAGKIDDPFPGPQ